MPAVADGRMWGLRCTWEAGGVGLGDWLGWVLMTSAFSPASLGLRGAPDCDEQHVAGAVWWEDELFPTRCVGSVLQMS